MFKKTVIILIMLSFVLSSAGCATHQQASEEGTYVVFGRVMDQEQKPVAGCKVVLVKRKLEFRNMRALAVNIDTVDTLGEYAVAKTDQTGDYSLFFQKLEANNLWLNYQAKGYVSRLVEIDDEMRGRLFADPGNSPLRVSVVLEREW